MRYQRFKTQKVVASPLLALRLRSRPHHCNPPLPLPHFLSTVCIAAASLDHVGNTNTNAANAPSPSSPDSLDSSCASADHDHVAAELNDHPLSRHDGSAQELPASGAARLFSDLSLHEDGSIPSALLPEANDVGWHAGVAVERERALSPLSQNLRDTIERTMTHVMRSSDRQQQHQQKSRVSKSPKRRSPHPFSTLIPRPRWKSPGILLLRCHIVIHHCRPEHRHCDLHNSENTSTNHKCNHYHYRHYPQRHDHHPHNHHRHNRRLFHTRHRARIACVAVTPGYVAE
jgi:hypothetical protein